MWRDCTPIETASSSVESWTGSLELLILNRSCRSVKMLDIFPLVDSETMATKSHDMVCRWERCFHTDIVPSEGSHMRYFGGVGLVYRNSLLRVWFHRSTALFWCRTLLWPDCKSAKQWCKGRYGRIDQVSKLSFYEKREKAVETTHETKREWKTIHRKCQDCSQCELCSTQTGPMQLRSMGHNLPYGWCRQLKVQQMQPKQYPQL